MNENDVARQLAKIRRDMEGDVERVARESLPQLEDVARCIDSGRTELLKSAATMGAQAVALRKASTGHSLGKALALAKSIDDVVEGQRATARSLSDISATIGLIAKKLDRIANQPITLPLSFIQGLRASGKDDD